MIKINIKASPIIGVTDEKIFHCPKCGVEVSFCFYIGKRCEVCNTEWVDVMRLQDELEFRKLFHMKGAVC